MKQLAPALVALTFALSVAPPAHADDAATVPVEASSDAAPEVHYPPASVRPRIIIGGIAVFGLAYAAAFGAASGWPEVPGAASLKAPFVGPWLALGQSDCALDTTKCVPYLSPKDAQTRIDTSVSCAVGDDACHAKVYVRDVAFALDAIVQLAGLGLIAEGILMKTEPSTPAKKPSLAGVVSVLPVPMVSSRFTGFGLVGSF